MNSHISSQVEHTNEQLSDYHWSLRDFPVITWFT